MFAKLIAWQADWLSKFLIWQSFCKNLKMEEHI